MAEPSDLPVPDRRIDARGLLCPLPVLRARKALANMPVGSVLEITADDPMAEIDMPHFCAEAGHELLGQRMKCVFLIIRGPRKNG